MKNKVVVLFLIIFFFSPNLLFAQDLSNAFSGGGNLDKIAERSGYNIDSKTNINTLVGTIIQTILSLIGVFFLVLMIYGGLLWMTDRGSSEQVEKAKKLITAAVIGMIIVVTSYAISYFVIKAISSSTLSG